MNYNGIVVVNAKNANFNAGFDGMPRRLPNGDIWATDKALKYCIREYLSKDEPIFSRRVKFFEKKKDGSNKLRYMTLKENYLKKCGKEDMPKDDEVLTNDLLGFIDIRLFGVAFAITDSNLSITGPCQINYGVNRFEGSSIYSSSILSPYRRGLKEKPEKKETPEKKEKERQQTTIGEETRADDVYYIYDVSLSMNSAKNQGIDISDKDIEKLKDSLKYAVDEVTSTTMFGCETVSMIWFKNKQDKIFNNLNMMVDIKKQKDAVIVDYSKVIDHIKSDIDVDSIETYESKVKNEGIV